jgi:hypothetical protein
VTSPMDDALRRTADAVERYAVPQRLIGLAAQSLEPMPAEVRRNSEVNALVDAIVRIAGEHGGPHDSCLTCHSVSNALAVAMGSVRAEADLALAQMLGDN